MTQYNYVEVIQQLLYISIFIQGFIEKLDSSSRLSSFGFFFFEH